MRPDEIIIDEVINQDDIASFDLEIEQSYEWYKSFLLDLSEKRKKFEKKLIKYADKVKNGVREKRNRWRMIETYWTIEEITILRYKILEEAVKDYPDLVLDKDMPNWTSDAIDVFEKERKEAAILVEKNFRKTIEDLLNNAR